MSDSGGVNVAATGNIIYAAIAGDPASCTRIADEFRELALAIATDPNASARITSATVNGQTFSSQATMTNGQRLHLLRWVVACIQRGGPISTTQLSTF
jgi:hypothetical protein